MRTNAARIALRLHAPSFRTPGGAVPRPRAATARLEAFALARPVSTFTAAKAAPKQPTVINPKLFEFLKANPTVKTVQQLVNATWSKGTFYATCKDLGLEANAILKYRSAALMDFAVQQPPGDGTAPRSVADANRFFITQYQDDTYNRESPNRWSNNCGPTSLAMVLKVNGRMPQGLTAEQQIDYARGLMYPKLAKSDGRDVMLPGGATVRVLDADKMLTNIDAATAGAQAGGLADAKHQKGWADFDAALNAGQSLVVEGNISAKWRGNFADEAKATGDTYQGGGDGHFMAVLGKTASGQYLVADPMFSGGTVEMSRDELAVFFAKQGGEPSFVAP